MAADETPVQPSASQVSVGGVSGLHDGLLKLPLLVGPTTAKHFNTIRPPLLPIACWRLEDLRFDFDSSFVKPEATLEFGALALLWNGCGKPPLSIFGHADPVGDDTYNKQLSGRRARAIYALLTRNADMWEALYAAPLGGDQWGTNAVQTMLLALGQFPGPVTGAAGAGTSQAVKNFQAANGLFVDGDAGPKTRHALYLAYMDVLAPGLVLAPTDFLARGADAGGKGDYQGCSEFNPVIVFSKDEDRELSKPDNHAARNAANVSNRRVLVFLFPSGTHIDAGDWPCPRSSEGTAACKAKFWPDADVRRNPQAKRRDYATDKNTFACAFYDSMAHRSPCEVIRKTLMIRILDSDKVAIPSAPYRLSIGNFETRQNVTQLDGWLVEPNVLSPSRCTLQWANPATADPAAKDTLPYQLSMYLDYDRGEDDEGFRRRLHNLGYGAHRDAPLADGVRLFQRDYDLNATGELDAPTKEALVRAHDQGVARNELGGS